ncbi:ion channel [Virgibacillus sp. 179-BFC.A HS]|uniref:Ion channel n=1 Tax=Tigheibacillus jepli TaxID=3035914 RepID=A0ABU5CKJ4_9BACI|nr:potassium channel family protein [Virgibacillus sp. 179-BFC.A HS]MDY0406882.1 ion channel [Virgibacillus sp. 179-BFC.A HS]
MRIIGWFFLVLVCFILVVSMITFVSSPKNAQRFSGRFSIEIFYTLLVMYSIFIIGFGMIYFILSFQGIVLVEGGKLNPVNVFGSLVHSLYFSGVTLLTIGYGDIIPVGIGRLIALIEALVGYVLPAAFVLRVVQTNQYGQTRDHDD